MCARLSGCFDRPALRLGRAGRALPPQRAHRSERALGLEQLSPGAAEPPARPPLQTANLGRQLEQPAALPSHGLGLFVPIAAALVKLDQADFAAVVEDAQLNEHQL